MIKSACPAPAQPTSLSSPDVFRCFGLERDFVFEFVALGRLESGEPLGDPPRGVHDGGHERAPNQHVQVVRHQVVVEPLRRESPVGHWHYPVFDAVVQGDAEDVEAEEEHHAQDAVEHVEPDPELAPAPELVLLRVVPHPPEQWAVGRGEEPVGGHDDVDREHLVDDGEAAVEQEPSTAEAVGFGVGGGEVGKEVNHLCNPERVPFRLRPARPHCPPPRVRFGGVVDDGQHHRHHAHRALGVEEAFQEHVPVFRNPVRVPPTHLFGEVGGDGVGGVRQWGGGVVGEVGELVLRHEQRRELHHHGLGVKVLVVHDGGLPD
mmetsp:Transcript_9326/g.18739  ORF Transcript_9326/g.18739 Transcript_9326/m.18739 type:complete len:319 (+) Transcript_9326:242-1198(+)